MTPLSPHPSPLAPHLGVLRGPTPLQDKKPENISFLSPKSLRYISKLSTLYLQKISELSTLSTINLHFVYVLSTKRLNPLQIIYVLSTKNLQPLFSSTKSLQIIYILSTNILRSVYFIYEKSPKNLLLKAKKKPAKDDWRLCSSSCILSNPPPRRRAHSRGYLLRSLSTLNLDSFSLTAKHSRLQRMCRKSVSWSFIKFRWVAQLRTDYLL